MDDTARSPARLRARVTTRGAGRNHGAFLYTRTLLSYYKQSAPPASLSLFLVVAEVEVPSVLFPPRKPTALRWRAALRRRVARGGGMCRGGRRRVVDAASDVMTGLVHGLHRLREARAL